MWSEGQWEALEKTAPDGTNRQTDRDVTHNTWHMPCDRWWTLYKSFRPVALICWDSWCFEDLEEQDCSLNQSVNDRGAYWTAGPGYTGSVNYISTWTCICTCKNTLCTYTTIVPKILLFSWVSSVVIQAQFRTIIARSVTICYTSTHKGHFRCDELSETVYKIADFWANLLPLKETSKLV